MPSCRKALTVEVECRFGPSSLNKRKDCIKGQIRSLLCFVIAKVRHFKVEKVVPRRRLVSATITGVYFSSGRVPSLPLSLICSRRFCVQRET